MEKLKTQIIIICRKIFIYAYYLFHPFSEDEKEKKDIRNFIIKSGPFRMSSFPYDFIYKYKEKDIQIHRDEDGFPFVNYKGKKMFGKKKWNDSQMRSYCCWLSREQDLSSPHCYYGTAGSIDQRRIPDNGMILADVGAAEGFWTLGFIDKISKAYLFESDAEWIDALQKTFQPYSDKIEIIRKYISNTDDKDTAALDTFFQERRIDFIKADIEGYEIKMFEGGKQTFIKVKRCLLCVYHSENSEVITKEFLKETGFNYQVNDGYMLFYYFNAIKPPFLRKGVIFGYKDK